MPRSLLQWAELVSSSSAVLQSDAVRRQLNSGCVVLLSNLGFSAAGEVLNCDIYTGERMGMGQSRLVAKVD